jgi:hypothetical protein
VFTTAVLYTYLILVVEYTKSIDLHTSRRTRVVLKVRPYELGTKFSIIRTSGLLSERNVCVNNGCLRWTKFNKMSIENLNLKI